MCTYVYVCVRIMCTYVYHVYVYLAHVCVMCTHISTDVKHVHACTRLPLCLMQKKTRYIIPARSHAFVFFAR